MRVALLVSIIALATQTGAKPEDDGRVDCVMRELASISGLEAKFREEKQLTLLKEPLVSVGSLFYSKPGSMLRRVEAPIRSRTLVRDDQLTIDGPGGRRSMQLSQNPAVRVFVDTFRMLLAGDLAALRGIHEIEFEGSSAGCEDWRLRLRPLQPGPVQEIQAAGNGRVVSELFIHDRGGNRTRIYFSQVDPARRFDNEERARLFTARAP